MPVLQRASLCVCQYDFVQAALPFMEPRDVSAVLWALASSGLGSEDDDLVVACMTRAKANLE